MKTTSLKMRGIIAIAAVGAALVATLGGCGTNLGAAQSSPAGSSAETASTRAAGVLLLSVNPEIEVEYDERGLVTEVEGVVPREMVEGAVRYRARALVEGKSERFVRDVADLSRYYIHRSAFENLVRNCERNDLRYARVPSGRETCGFCFMLSSRGFVYKTAREAGEGHDYHENCDCVIVPGYRDEERELGIQIEGYDPDLMADHWNDCKATIGGEKELRKRWESMIDEQRARYKGDNDAERYLRFANAQTIREVEIRDFRWLNAGQHSGIEFTDASVRNKKLAAWKKDDGEKITADKFNRLGYRSEFWDDETHIPNPHGKGTITIGRPDLSTGVEIKTMYSMSSENTFKKHMKNCEDKKGLRFVLIDLSENDHVSSGALKKDEIIRWTRKYMHRYRIPESRILWSDDDLEIIRQ